jgi:hypothetical protein
MIDNVIFYNDLNEKKEADVIVDKWRFYSVLG